MLIFWSLWLLASEGFIYFRYWPNSLKRSWKKMPHTFCFKVRTGRDVLLDRLSVFKKRLQHLAAGSLETVTNRHDKTCHVWIRHLDRTIMLFSSRYSSQETFLFLQTVFISSVSKRMNDYVFATVRRIVGLSRMSFMSYQSGVYAFVLFWDIFVGHWTPLWPLPQRSHRFSWERSAF